MSWSSELSSRAADVAAASPPIGSTLAHARLTTSGDTAGRLRGERGKRVSQVTSTGTLSPMRQCSCWASMALSTLLIRAIRLSSSACPESTSFKLALSTVSVTSARNADVRSPILSSPSVSKASVLNASKISSRVEGTRVPTKPVRGGPAGPGTPFCSPRLIAQGRSGFRLPLFIVLSAARGRITEPAVPPVYLEPASRNVTGLAEPLNRGGMGLHSSIRIVRPLPRLRPVLSIGLNHWAALASAQPARREMSYGAWARTTPVGPALCGRSTTPLRPTGPTCRACRRLCSRSGVASSNESDAATQDPATPTGSTAPNAKVKRENLYTIPNILTFSRIAVTPVVGYFIATEQWANAFGLGFVAGFTDWLDGFIARRYPSQATVIGGVIDPIADKLMIMTVTLGLSVVGGIPWWLGAVIVSRDLGLLSTSLYIRHVSLRAHFDQVTWARYWDFGYPTVIVTPTALSKYNTLIQGVTLLCSLAAPATGWVDPDHPALAALWFTTAATTVASGASYLVANDALLFLRPPTTALLHRLPEWATRRLEK
eukprot:m.130924 g.130924  ORF g.130924 m.130924 type:complete len:543 (-) comp13735_c0_seq4:100-1728(-)